MWKGRFTETTAKVVQAFTQSLDLDWSLAGYDIEGSIAHARMLGSVGLLSAEELRRIEEGLSMIRDEISSGTFLPSEELEDVHMNIESRLIELLGPTGAKLHTGRSRNDQVSVTMRLFLRDRLLRICTGIEALLAVLLERAAHHIDNHRSRVHPSTAGAAHLHGPLLDGSLYRIFKGLRAASFCSRIPQRMSSGAGALAGSTLPLDREFTATLLGFPGRRKTAWILSHRGTIWLTSTPLLPFLPSTAAVLRRISLSILPGNSGGFFFLMLSAPDPA